MKDKEIILLEAIRSMFDNDPILLGIARGKPKTDPTNRAQRQYGYINDLFGLKVADSVFYESLRSAFYDIHSYKFINDPNFCESFRTRCKAIGIPECDINCACEAVCEINEELKKDMGVECFDERSAGWHPNLQAVMDTTREPNKKVKREEPYTGGGPWPSADNT